ncbi:MAG TPA: hypothetical protein VL944_00530 [Candidatus Acidoferrum sp.]|nr:hypothetical protein [Candidatus Acidoferrum sp.]
MQGIRHIIDRHPEINGMLKEIEETLREPTIVITSKYDRRVWIYYRFYHSRKGYLSVVVRIFNGEGLLLTCYITDRIKAGEEI